MSKIYISTNQKKALGCVRSKEKALFSKIQSLVCFASIDNLIEIQEQKVFLISDEYTGDGVTLGIDFGSDYLLYHHKIDRGFANRFESNKFESNHLDNEDNLFRKTYLIILDEEIIDKYNAILALLLKRSPKPNPYWSFLNAIEGDSNQPKQSLQELETSFPDFVGLEAFQNVKPTLFDSEGNNIYNKEQHREIIKNLKESKPTSTN